MILHYPILVVHKYQLDILIVINKTTNSFVDVRLFCVNERQKNRMILPRVCRFSFVSPSQVQRVCVFSFFFLSLFLSGKFFSFRQLAD